MVVQRPARVMAHGGVKGGGDRMAGDTRGLSDGDDADGRGAHGGATQMESQSDTEDSEGQGEAGT